MARALRALNDDGDREHQAAMAEVRDFAESLPEKYLYCREMGHNWRPFSAGRYRDEDGGGFERVLRCTRCRCKRFQTISQRGLIVGSKYEHPEGYLHKGMGPITGEGRGVIRLESITRIVRSFEEE
jgi:hypothetical protein